ncbi:trichohyalin-like isoform X2 [Thrips palmi]|uniref:Trichohyalin-like isoform X2 n=1 Tax=Thrips palmi TaxID=161013 RepID=A0A6P8ZI38_THRPL|nr:trichohyalin-like isoform X2 [Thrips palmi]
MTDGGGGDLGAPASRRSSEGLEEVRMVRADPAPWGFRLMGGRDYSHQLTVTRVLGCSIAEHAGLKVGDVLLSVNGASVRSATHMEAQEALRAAGDSLSLGVLRGTLDMPPPLEVDKEIPLIQPPLAHEPGPLPDGVEASEATPDGEVPDTGAADGEQGTAAEQADELEAAAEDTPADAPPQEENAEEAEEDVEDEDEGEEEEEEEEEEEDEEERKARLNKMDGLRTRMSKSPGPEDIIRMQEKALARMERARARKDRPPTVFLLPPDRPVIRQPRAPRVRPPDPPFKKLVQERIRRRKWAEDHPGEEYPFAEELGRTPTPDSELTTRATMTPTPTFSDVISVELLDDASEFLDGDAVLETDAADEDGASVGGRSSALREDGTASRASRASRNTQDDVKDDLQEEEEPEVLTSLSVQETERRVEEVTAQLDALHNLPRALRPSVEHIKEELQQVVASLLQQLEDLRRQEEEARQAEAARVAAEQEAAARAERERLEAERAERERLERLQEARRLEEARAARPAFKTDVPDFIHEMTEKLSLERPSFPLTPLPRPIVLPGGRKWRTVADAFNEDFIAETLTSQAEVLLGKALGNRRLSNTFPALIHERAEINESCYGCGRINFLKYSHKHDNLKNSAVYRMVHGLDDKPALPIADRPEKMQAVNDYYEAAARSAAPSPVSELGRVTAAVKPGNTLSP